MKLYTDDTNKKFKFLYSKVLENAGKKPLENCINCEIKGLKMECAAKCQKCGNIVGREIHSSYHEKVDDNTC